MSPKCKQKVKKLVSISATFTSVIRTKKEAVKTDETAGASKNGKESKGEYLENLIQVLCI